MVLYEAGIDIPPGYQVHHINGDKQDNRLENLEVVTPREHAERHGVASNQFGTFPVLTDPEARRERKRIQNRERQAYQTAWRRAKRARIKAEQECPES
jgi:hypothetical protein